MSEAHAFCAPSGWEKWSHCAGSAALEDTEPERTNEYSQEGTLAHELAARLLRGESAELPADLAPGIRCYVAAVQARVAAHKAAGAVNVLLLVEQKLDISVITGEKNAKGTADTLIIAEYRDYAELEVWDLKFGMGVPVLPANNGQLMIYALAALIKYSLLHDFSKVTLVIHQPRLREVPDEWDTTSDALYIFGQSVTEKANLALSLRDDVTALSHLCAGDWCHSGFCKVAYRCPALAQAVHQEVFGEFQSIEDAAAVALEPADTSLSPKDLPAKLGLAMSKVPMIEKWCLTVRAAVERELLANRPIVGFKLVMGRRGARAWIDESAAEKLLLADGQNPDVIFNPRKLKTPSALEKELADAPILKSLAELIRQAEGKPSVAPVKDKRAAWSASALNDFETHDGNDLV